MEAISIRDVKVFEVNDLLRYKNFHYVMEVFVKLLKEENEIIEILINRPINDVEIRNKLNQHITRKNLLAEILNDFEDHLMSLVDKKDSNFTDFLLAVQNTKRKKKRSLIWQKVRTLINHLRNRLA